ncbi:MAG: lipase family protein [Spartobacteria bacterium]
MNLNRKIITLACTLSTISFAQAEIPIDYNQPPTPSATKSRFAPPFTGGKPGDLLSHKEIGTGIKGARAWKVRYISKDVNGVLYEVSGMVIAPKEKGKNRKVMTWCHGTTGLGDAASPSAQPNPAREFLTYFDTPSAQQIDCGVPGLQDWINDGYVVCATDYQGLGTPGQHQYVVNRTQARDAVYLVHAARKMEEISVGTKFGASGWSQGGGAAAAVAELDEADYGELKLVGTVPMSPGVASIAYGMPKGLTAALSDPSIPPDGHLLMVLAGFQIANSDVLKLSDYFAPLGVEIIETSWNIQPVHHFCDTVARLFRLKGAIMQSKPTNLDRWQAAITAGSAATRKPVAPVLMCMDTFDGGTVVPVPWQEAYAEKVKELGGSIEIKEYPHDDHFSLPNHCAPAAREWLTGLFK